MEIRELSEVNTIDLKEALSLVWAVFNEFESPDYVPEGITVFREFISFDSISKMLEKGTLRLWASYEGEVLTGVIAVRGQTHISLLFVHREYHRRGIARALFTVVERSCKSADMDTITVNSSPFAVGAYHSLGFVDTDNETVINGIRFTPMRYEIGHE